MCERRQAGGFPLVDYHPEAGGGGITVSERTKIEESKKLEDWTGRDKPIIVANFSGSSGDEVERQKRLRDEMGRAFMTDIGQNVPREANGANL